jgi:uncharacterized membrane protein YeaQ/YmgE (transglycosylase-associated protein family)
VTLIALIGLLIIGLFVALVVMLIVPLIIGALANRVSGVITDRPLNLGCLGYIIIAFLGALVGNLLFGNFGPRISDIYIVPAFFGSIIVTIILSIIVGYNRRRRNY